MVFTGYFALTVNTITMIALRLSTSLIARYVALSDCVVHQGARTVCRVHLAENAGDFLDIEKALLSLLCTSDSGRSVLAFALERAAIDQQGGTSR